MICVKYHRALGNVPPVVELKCASPGRWFSRLGRFLLARTAQVVWIGGARLGTGAVECGFACPGRWADRGGQQLGGERDEVDRVGT